MPHTLDEVHDLIDSWELDPAVDTVVLTTELLETMTVGDPGRVHVIQVLADHQAMRGEVDAALATLERADAREGDADALEAMRVCFLLEDGRDDEADPLLRDLRRRGAELPVEALERVAETLEACDRLRESMRWFTIGLRDLDPHHDIPDQSEEYALFGRRRVREALELPPDHFDTLARTILDGRRTARGELLN